MTKGIRGKIGTSMNGEKIKTMGRGTSGASR